jgi:hypothetical protein
MLDKPIAANHKGKAKLEKRIRTPPFNPDFDPELEHFDNYEESGYDWRATPVITHQVSRDPSISLGDSDDPYNFDDDSTEYASDAPRQVGTLSLYSRMDVDDDIADAAGLSAKGKGKQRERQVPLSRTKHLLTTPQCTRGSTSAQAKEEPLSSDVDYKCALLALVNSLNKIELHTQKCEKCKHKMVDRTAWILDSGASKHFTSTKVDFIDYEVISNAPEVQTASKATLRIEGKGTILLNHLVKNRGTRVVKTTRIYPVLYIPGLSVKLLQSSFLPFDGNRFS